jgi:DNA-binding NarL/FixJ family response regulator
MKKENKTILIVDDSNLVMERMIDLLEEMEQIKFVVHAGSYSEALEMLGVLTPDLVLLDISLPDKSGLELLRLLRKEYKDIAVIMLTNTADDYYRDTCKKLGAVQFLDKSGDYRLMPELLSAAC